MKNGVLGATESMPAGIFERAKLTCGSLLLERHNRARPRRLVRS